MPTKIGTALTYFMGHTCQLFIYCYWGNELILEVFAKIYFQKFLTSHFFVLEPIVSPGDLYDRLGVDGHGSGFSKIVSFNDAQVTKGAQYIGGRIWKFILAHLFECKSFTKIRQFWFLLIYSFSWCNSPFPFSHFWESWWRNRKINIKSNTKIVCLKSTEL